MEVHYIQFKESLRTRVILNLIMNAQEQSRLSAHTSGVFKNENSEHDLLCGYLQS